MHAGARSVVGGRRRCGRTLRTMSLDLSIVVPVLNERDNVEPLMVDIVREADELGVSYEVIVVDDGSRDGTGELLDQLVGQYRQLTVIHFDGNFGQTAAMAAGWENSTGRIIVTMDGDRQNDPADIAMLLRKLDEGYDCVSGWRQKRQDTGLRRWPSIVANRIISHITRVELHDYGCTLKAYRRGSLNPAHMYGEMHRFLPAFVVANGGRVAELVVRHHARVAGSSKYGLNRTARVIADLFLIRLLTKYRTRPSHLFARVAQALTFAAAGMMAIAGIQWLFRWGPLFGFPFLAAVTLGVGAVVVLTVGLTTELVFRGHYLDSDRRYWRIKRRVP